MNMPKYCHINFVLMQSDCRHFMEKKGNNAISECQWPRNYCIDSNLIELHGGLGRYVYIGINLTHHSHTGMSMKWIEFSGKAY